MDILQYTKVCLERSTERGADIARGAGVSQSWLYMFRNGHIRNPTYDNLRLLADYFMRKGETLVLQDEPPVARREVAR